MKHDTLEAIWDGERIRRFRMAHLAGERVQGCESCYMREDVGSPSLRQEANARFAQRAAEFVRNTDANGHAPQPRPIDYDVRFSNICNFKCRSCNHSLSSKWYSESMAVYGRRAGPQAILRVFEDPRAFWAAFGNFIDDVESINFAGGEPLLQDEHYEILQALCERRKFDVLIHYNTNFSVLEHRAIDVMTLWRNFRNLRVAASLDGSGIRGEVLRHGQSWPAVLENRERLRRECPNISFEVSCAISAMNVWHVSDFHRELIDTGFIAPHEFEINLVQDPTHLRAQVLPRELKRAVEAKISAHSQWLRERGEQVMADGFDAVSRYLWAQDHSDLIPSLRAFTATLDGLRDENTAAAFPELRAMLA